MVAGVVAGAAAGVAPKENPPAGAAVLEAAGLAAAAAPNENPPAAAGAGAAAAGAGAGVAEAPKLNPPAAGLAAAPPAEKLNAIVPPPAKIYSARAGPPGGVVCAASVSGRERELLRCLRSAAFPSACWSAPSFLFSGHRRRPAVSGRRIGWVTFVVGGSLFVWGLCACVVCHT